MSYYQQGSSMFVILKSNCQCQFDTFTYPPESYDLTRDETNQVKKKTFNVIQCAFLSKGYLT